MTWKVRAYYNVNPFVGVSWHDTMVPIPLPPFMIPGKLPHIDFSVVQGLWLGSFLSNGRDRKVLADDLLYVGRMSDAGLIIPHISIPPSWYNLLTTLFGGSNALFGASSVTIACKNLLWGNEDCDLATSPFPIAPISLNLGCWDPLSLPTDIVVLWGTTYAGMSLADLLAALIDFAIQWAIEGLMWLGGKALQKGFQKLAKKGTQSAGKAAAKRAAAKGAKKGVFATAGEKIVNAFKKATGATASDAYKTYLKKAAKVKGIKNVLAMSDDDLAKFVKKSGVFSETLEDVAGNFSEGYKKFGNKYGKQVKGLNRAVIDAETDATRALRQLKLIDFVDSGTASDAVKKTMLREALEELDTAVAKVASEEVIFQVELKLAMKSLSNLYKMIVVSGNAFGSGTEGGIFSFEGAGWTNDFARKMQWKDRWSWNFASSLIADEEVEYVAASATASEGTLETAEEDDDYWYTATLAEESESSSDAEDEDDDYWYESDSDESSPAASAE